MTSNATVDLLLPGVWLRSLQRFADERGSFLEIFRQAEAPEGFVQANHSHSKEGVLRGLHYHHHQADLWYLCSGEAQVALVDLREQDPTLVTTHLEASVPTALYIPRGVAHGYLALTDLDLIYWVTNEYDGSDEHGIAWNDPKLQIPWKHADPILSPRDIANPPLNWDDLPRFS